MKGQLQKRPESKRIPTLRPITSQVSEANRKQSEQCFQMGKQHMVKEQYEQALRHYFNATIHDPNNFKAFCNMGMIFKRLGNFQEAKKAYLRALLANPEDAISLYNIGNLFRVTGDDDAALEHYEKVLKLKEVKKVDIGSLYVSSCINMGVCYKNMGKYDEAIQLTSRALSLTPNDQSAQFNKAMCLLRKIQLTNRDSFSKVLLQLCEQAQSAFKRVLQINPNSTMSKVELIQITYIKEPIKQQFKRALEKFEEVLKTANISEDEQYIKVKIAYCNAAINKFEESEKFVKEDLKKDLKEIKEAVGKQKSPSRPATKKSSNKYDRMEEEGQKSPIKVYYSRPESNASIQEPSQKELEDKGMTKVQIIDMLLSQGRYDEAFDVAKEIPEGPLQYQKEIYVNVRQSEDTGEEYFLNSAWSIYEQKIIQFDRSKPITLETCSPDAHSIYATMLNILGQYQQAIKHYEVLMHHLQDKQQKDTHDTEQLKQIYADIGICYAGSNSLNKAIEEFKKSLKLQPDNYFLLTNLGGSLVEENRKEEALALYQDYFSRAGGDNMEDKPTYIDCLLNMAICQTDQREQLAALQKTRVELEKYFPTYEAIRQNLSQQAILGLYLRLTEITESQTQKTTDVNLKKQINYRLLNYYLAILEFPECPDRSSINFNCGILLFLSGCYVNAYAFLKNAAAGDNVIANTLGLTLAHLDQFKSSLMYMKYACENEPENVICRVNFEVMRWVCGVAKDEEQDQNIAHILQEKYPHDAEGMFFARLELGLSLLGKLTILLMQNAISSEVEQKSTMQEQVKATIKKLYEQESPLAENKKISFLKSYLEKVEEKCKEEEKINSQFKIPSQMMQLAWKKCQSVPQIEANFQQIYKFIETIPITHENYFTIIYTVISIFFIANKQYQYKIKNLCQLSDPANLIKFESQQSAKENPFYHTKSLQLANQSSLSFKVLRNILHENEAAVENLSVEMISFIEKVYYDDSESIRAPMRREFVYPHCDKIFDCPNCWIKAINLLFNAVECSPESEKNSLAKEDWKKNFKAFPIKFQEFIDNELKKQNNLFDPTKNILTIKNNPNLQPFVLKTFHKQYKDVQKFISIIDPSFKLPDNNSDKGAQLVEINKNLLMELSWGQTSQFNRYWSWVGRRKTIHEVDSLLQLDGYLSSPENMDTFIQNGNYWQQKINKQVLLFNKVM